MFTEMVARFHSQDSPAGGQFVLPHEREALASVGYSPQEMYAYVEDYARLGDPSPSTVLLIAAARRSFFLTVQRGIAGSTQLRETDLPSPEETLQDISYLPRIIRKAEAKLYGTLPLDLLILSLPKSTQPCPYTFLGMGKPRAISNAGQMMV